MYQISNDLLVDPSIQRAYSPHKSSGRNVCDFVIMHYTGSHGTASSSNAWAKDPRSKVSWHIIIDRDGTVYQMCNFREIGWHAGDSAWYAKQVNRQYKYMNQYSIGIEIANAGLLTYKNGAYYNPYGVVIPRDRVIVTPDNKAWEKFTDIQIQKSYEVALSCAQKYNCVDILGHNEISPGRKIDPGEAYPLRDLKQKLYSQPWYKF